MGRLQRQVNVGKWLLGTLVYMAVVLSVRATDISFSSMSVKSKIGEPFCGEIDLHSESPFVFSTLYARIGGQGEYEKMGLYYNHQLDEFKIFLLRRLDDKPYLKIVGSSPFELAQFDMVLTVFWDENAFTRVDSLVLDRNPNFIEHKQSEKHHKNSSAKSSYLNKSFQRNIEKSKIDRIENQLKLLKKELRNGFLGYEKS